jgi:hypothetical protein
MPFCISAESEEMRGDRGLERWTAYLADMGLEGSVDT